MDEYVTNMFVNDNSSPPTGSPDRDENSKPAAEAPTTPPKGIRGRVAALRDKAAVQDRLLEK